MTTSPLALTHPHLLEHPVNGGVIRIGLLSPTEFEFTTGPYPNEDAFDVDGVRLRGVRLRFAGRALTLPNSFALSRVEVSHCESSDEAWSPEDTSSDYFRRLVRDIESLVRAAHERLVAPEFSYRLEQAFLDRVDAERAGAIDSLLRRRSHLGVEKIPSRQVCDDWLAEDLRRLDGIDTHASSHEHPFSTVPGYVVMTGDPGEHLLHARPLGWGRNPKGWHGRLVFDRYSAAEALVFELGLDASAIHQVRLQDGNLLLRDGEGYGWLAVDEEKVVDRDMRVSSPSP